MSFQASSSELRTRDLCFIDIETTGTVFGHHEIIEIAALRMPPDAAFEKRSWHQRLKPLFPERITPYAQELTAYESGRWSDAVSSDRKLWEELARIADGCIPVCHNPSFDRAFVSLAAGAAGVQDLGLDYHWIGTESLAWPLYRRGVLENLALADLCESLQVGAEPRPHNALDGARACVRAYRALMKLAEAPALHAARAQ